MSGLAGPGTKRASTETAGLVSIAGHSLRTHRVLADRRSLAAVVVAGVLSVAPTERTAATQAIAAAMVAASDGGKMHLADVQIVAGAALAIVAGLSGTLTV